MNTKNLFNLLKDKVILAILDGDTDFSKEGDSIRIALPYLSGPTICDLSTRFGNPMTYGWNGGSPSRWSLMDSLIDYAIKNDKISDLLLFLFSKEQFRSVIKNMSPDEIEEAYSKIVGTVISQINGILYFGGNELQLIGKTFIIKPINSRIEIAAPTIKVIDAEYIKDLVMRANKDITEKNYDSALTKARTMLEEVFCYVIEQNGDVPSDKGDIGKLYGQVKTIFKMHQSKELDNRINGLLGGLEKILKAITEMRNDMSDSHGVGSKRLKIDEHHARLVVNSAMIFADFILAIHKNKIKSGGV